MRPYLWLINFIGLIVPRRLRVDWRQEWEAELRYRERLLADWDRLNWRYRGPVGLISPIGPRKKNPEPLSPPGR